MGLVDAPLVGHAAVPGAAVVVVAVDRRAAQALVVPALVAAGAGVVVVAADAVVRVRDAPLQAPSQQASSLVQASPSSQASPSTLSNLQPSSESQKSFVQRLSSSHTFGFWPVQAPSQH